MIYHTQGEHVALLKLVSMVICVYNKMSRVDILNKIMASGQQQFPSLERHGYPFLNKKKLQEVCVISHEPK